MINPGSFLWRHECPTWGIPGGIALIICESCVLGKHLLMLPSLTMQQCLHYCTVVTIVIVYIYI